MPDCGSWRAKRGRAPQSLLPARASNHHHGHRIGCQGEARSTCSGKPERRVEHLGPRALHPCPCPRQDHSVLRHHGDVSAGRKAERRQAWTRRSPRTRRDDGLKSESFGLGRWWLATMAGALEPNRQRRPWRQNRGHARSVGEFRASLRVPKASRVPRLCRNTHGSRFGLPEGRALGSPMARWHERR